MSLNETLLKADAKRLQQARDGGFIDGLTEAIAIANDLAAMWRGAKVSTAEQLLECAARAEALEGLARGLADRLHRESERAAKVTR